MSVNNKGTNDVTKETKKCEKKKKKELDRILDSALDDLSDDDDDDEVQTQTLPPKNNQSTTSTSSRNQQEKEEEMLAASLEEMMKSFMETMKQNDDAGTSSSSSGHHDDDDDRIHQDLTKALQQIDEQMKMAMSLQENDPKENMTVETNNKSASKGKKKKKKNVEEVDKTVAKILNDMAKAGAAVPDNHVGGMEPAQVEAMGEEIMQEMMKEFEHMGQKGDSDQVVNGMMHQLLDKEIMYEPMKQVNDKFPEWLAKNKPYLSKTDYERYGHQYQGFQRIVHVYENDPNNIPRLMELMQDIQE